MESEMMMYKAMWGGGGDPRVLGSGRGRCKLDEDPEGL